MEKAKVIYYGEEHTFEGTYEKVNDFLMDFLYDQWLLERRAANIPDEEKGIVSGVGNIGGYGYNELHCLDNTAIVNLLNNINPGIKVYYMPE